MQGSRGGVSTCTSNRVAGIDQCQDRCPQRRTVRTKRRGGKAVRRTNDAVRVVRGCDRVVPGCNRVVIGCDRADIRAKCPASRARATTSDACASTSGNSGIGPRRIRRTKNPIATSRDTIGYSSVAFAPAFNQIATCSGRITIAKNRRGPGFVQTHRPRERARGHGAVERPSLARSRPQRDQTKQYFLPPRRLRGHTEQSRAHSQRFFCACNLWHA